MRTLGIRLAALAAAFLAAPAAASAQELWRALQEDAEVQFEELPMKTGILMMGRISGIAGEVDPWIPADYEDLFGLGYGVAVEGRLMWEVEPGGWMGGYVSLGWDRYDGRRDTDAYGDSLEPDSMEITTVLAGVKAIFMVGPRVYVEAHAGLGGARYGDVDGTLTVSGVPGPVGIFDSSTVAAFDMGGRIGYARRRFVAEIGFGLRFQGAPDSADLDLDSSGPVIFALEAALGMQF